MIVQSSHSQLILCRTFIDIFISEITSSVDDSLISFVTTYPVYHSRLKFDQWEFVLVYDCQLKLYQWKLAPVYDSYYWQFNFIGDKYLSCIFIYIKENTFLMFFIYLSMSHICLVCFYIFNCNNQNFDIVSFGFSWLVSYK
jgi:hypothetical protein